MQTEPTAEAIAHAIADVRVNRKRLDTARLELKDAARDLENSIREAHRIGASIRELEEPSKLGKTYIGDLVRGVRDAG